ncbi:MAG TPA: hypothetical protein DCS82_12145 [Rhodospirillaceae bacterium]|nr:hypothetical protein [Rhodospirillaceae bacterium]HAT36461.1 hypothetical protein [Rhodospirillaceae bacterium]
MRTLYLLRHAKSDWSEAGVDDKDRPLNPRGRRGATAISEYCREHDICPSLILCSTAVRTRETLSFLKPALDCKPKIEFEDALYLAGAHEIVARVRAVDNTHPTIMVIGHNPGMHHVANDLVGSDECGQSTAMASKYPTAALAQIAFATDDWSGIASGDGLLKSYVTPKML